MSQGVLQGQITKYASNDEKLKELMSGKPDDVIDKARKHLKTVRALRAKK